MALWKRPDLEPGPLRDLNDALHELRDRTGLSSRRIAAAVARRFGRGGPSHTTVHQLFTQPRLQPAELVLRVAEILLDAQRTGSAPAREATLDHIDRLWRAAADPSPTPTPPTSPPMSPARGGPRTRWRLAPVLPEGTPGALLDVTAAGPAHAWAVGWAEDHRPASFAWDGAAWSRMPGVPWHGGFCMVAAGSTTGVWAVGYGDDGESRKVLRLHDGAWHDVAFPRPAARVTGIDAVGDTVWLVGHDSMAMVIVEWDGHRWREHQPPPEAVALASFGGGLPSFCSARAVAAFAPDDVWLAGNGSWPGHTGAALFHFDGDSWLTIRVAAEDEHRQEAFEAVAGRPGDVWAVGNAHSESFAAVVVRGDGDAFERVDGLPPFRLVDLAVDRDGRPWVIESGATPNAAIASYDGTWTHTALERPPGAHGLSLHAITAVPGTDGLLAVGSGDLLGDARTCTPALYEHLPDAG